LRRAVMQVGRGHSKLCSRKQGRGTGRKEARLSNHVCTVSLTPILSRRPVFILVSWSLNRRRRKRMTLQQRIEQDTVAAMKERAQARLDVLRMVKPATKSKESEKRAPLSDAEILQTLTTLIKQRRESIEQFTKGNRPELAEKEAAEIKVIEGYMPQQA